MKHVPMHEHEIKWLLRHVNFQNNLRLYQKLISQVRQEECILSNRAYIVNTINEDQPQVIESYDLHEDIKAAGKPLLGFHTGEQYFTDPVHHKIYFSEKGFIFYTEGKVIYFINRETGKTERTGYDHIASGESLLDIRKDIPYLKVHDEYFWPMSTDEEGFHRDIEEARARLAAKSDEDICPKCKGSVLVSDDSIPGNRNFFCPGCEANLRKEPHGWIIK